jgi:hypothetical protein
MRETSAVCPLIARIESHLIDRSSADDFAATRGRTSRGLLRRRNYATGSEFGRVHTRDESHLPRGRLGQARPAKRLRSTAKTSRIATPKGPSSLRLTRRGRRTGLSGEGEAQNGNAGSNPDQPTKAFCDMRCAVFLWLTFLTAFPIKASLNINTEFVRESVVYVYGGDAAGSQFGFAETADHAAERAYGMRQTVVRRGKEGTVHVFSRRR